MNVSILKRIAALESRVQKPEASPSLISIRFCELRNQWSISETYISGKGKNQTFKTKEIFVDRLKDYFFPAEGNARVILDAIGSPDPDIYADLFWFDLAELRKDLRRGDTGAISIATIRGSDEAGITCEIVAFTK